MPAAGPAATVGAVARSAVAFDAPALASRAGCAAAAVVPLCAREQRKDRDVHVGRPAPAYGRRVPILR